MIQRKKMEASVGHEMENEKNTIKQNQELTFVSINSHCNINIL